MNLIRLREDEADRIKWWSGRTGFVGVARFRGPRGRRYRPTRTEVCRTVDEAIEALDEIAHGRYRNNPILIGTDVHEVRPTGEVINE